MKSIKTIPLFSGLDDEQIARLEALAVIKTFPRSGMIFNEGDGADGFYMVADGKIKVFKLSAEGKEQILHIYGPGHTFGEVPVFQGNRFPASAMALEKSSIIFLPREKFVTLISQSPNLALNMLADLARRLREFTVQIEHLSLKEVPGRLAAYVITLSKEQGSNKKVELPISKAQLSNLIGTTPETVSRVLKKMMENELIDVDAKTIRILDLEGLIDLAESGTLA